MSQIGSEARKRPTGLLPGTRRLGRAAEIVTAVVVALLSYAIGVVIEAIH